MTEARVRLIVRGGCNGGTAAADGMLSDAGLHSSQQTAPRFPQTVATITSDGSGINKATQWMSCRPPAQQQRSVLAVVLKRFY